MKTNVCCWVRALLLFLLSSPSGLSAMTSVYCGLLCLVCILCYVGTGTWNWNCRFWSNFTILTHYSVCDRHVYLEDGLVPWSWGLEIHFRWISPSREPGNMVSLILSCLDILLHVDVLCFSNPCCFMILGKYRILVKLPARPSFILLPDFFYLTREGRRGLKMQELLRTVGLPPSWYVGI